MAGLFQNLISFIYPRICAGCGKVLVGGEEHICLNCLADLPVTGFENDIDNPVAKIFWGRIGITHATALCRFDKGGKLQHMLHQLKYKGNYKVGQQLGALLGYRLIQSSYFKDIDAIVPVPLHPKKEKSRGYNQSAEIGKGVAEVMEKPLILHYLTRKKYSESQTQKGRFERWENVAEIFEVRDEKVFGGRHLLLIDDVVTSGATLEACSRTLLNVKDVRVSIATIAIS